MNDYKEVKRLFTLELYHDGVIYYSGPEPEGGLPAVLRTIADGIEADPSSIIRLS